MFKITDISSPSKLPLSNINFRDLNKRFGKRGDYIELQVLSLSDEILSTFNLSKNFYQIVEKDSDNLTDELKINFASALKSKGFEVGKFKLKVSVLRSKVIKGKSFSIKEISPSRKELRIIANDVSNESFKTGLVNYIAERDSSPFFKDFSLKFDNEDILGINIILNDLVSKFESCRDSI